MNISQKLRKLPFTSYLESQVKMSVLSVLSVLSLLSILLVLSDLSELPKVSENDLLENSQWLYL